MHPVVVVRRIGAALAAIAIAVVLVGQPVVALAGSGWKLDTTCCCPDLQHCKCPHGNGGNSSPIARKCGDSGHVIVPLEVVVVAPPALPMLIALAPAQVVAVPAPPPHPAPLREIETPPF